METEKCHICGKAADKDNVMWKYGRDNKPICNECHSKLRAEIKIFWCSDCNHWLPFAEIGMVGCSRDRCNKCYGGAN